jgi:hypothetical protein
VIVATLQAVDFSCAWSLRVLIQSTWMIGAWSESILSRRQNVQFDVALRRRNLLSAFVGSTAGVF